MSDLARNKKAWHDYTVLETFEAGIALSGTEVKSCRLHNITLTDGYARVVNGQVEMHNVHISPYAMGNRHNHEPVHPRKLLLHRREIRRLATATEQRGCTLIPLSLYLKGGLVKVQLGLCKGKRQADKRESLKERDAARAVQQALRGRQRE